MQICEFEVADLLLLHRPIKRLLDLPAVDIYSPENQPLVRRIDQARGKNSS